MCLIILTGYKMDRMSSTFCDIAFWWQFSIDLKTPKQKHAKTIDIKLILVMIALWEKHGCESTGSCWKYMLKLNQQTFCCYFSSVVSFSLNIIALLRLQENRFKKKSEYC